MLMIGLMTDYSKLTNLYIITYYRAIKIKCEALLTLLRITCWFATQVVRIDLQSTQLQAICSTSGAVRRITIDPFSKKTNSDPDYKQVIFFRCSTAPNQKQGWRQEFPTGGWLFRWGDYNTVFRVLLVQKHRWQEFVKGTKYPITFCARQTDYDENNHEIVFIQFLVLFY